MRVVTAVKIGDVIGRRRGTGGYMARGNQPAAQQRLLVFAVQLENFDEQVLKHLYCAIYI